MESGRYNEKTEQESDSEDEDNKVKYSYIDKHEDYS